MGPNQGTFSMPVEGRIYIYIYIHTHTHIYTYIYIERERERELEEELLQISSSVSFLSFAFLMEISLANNLPL